MLPQSMLLISKFFMLRKVRFATLVGAGVLPLTAQAQWDDIDKFQKEILPILEHHCYDCHGEGEDKGNVSFDTFASHEALMEQTELWLHALKNVRAGLMPPVRKGRLSDEEMATLEEWIKRGPLKLDPLNPDPGRVTLRRLNRIEYRNTIRDLMGIDFRTDEEFPADDTGYGFDSIGDVLTTSPLLLEKYMLAAETIVARAVPLESRVTRQQTLPAGKFTGTGARQPNDSEFSISLYEPTDLVGTLEIERPGTYRVILNAEVRGSFAYDVARADASWQIDGNEVLRQELKWHESLKLDSSVEMKWSAGSYPLRFKMTPLMSEDQRLPDRGDGQPRVDLKFRGVTLIGPLEPEFAERPPNYARFFTREEVPQDEAGRHEYTQEILRRFTTRAFRRPADDATVNRLADLARETAAAPDGSFERGIARAMTAVLASPRFLFRLEDVLPADAPDAHPLLDEFALATRLSYFLWSTMPDEALYQLAERGELRKNLKAQVARMLEDPRSDELVKHFSGQWLQTRDVESVSIDARIVQARDEGTEKDMAERFLLRRRLSEEMDKASKAGDEAKLASLQKELDEFRAKFGGRRRVEFGGSLRTSMRREAEMLFRHLLRTDGSVLDLIQNDSTFLNEELANHYGVPGVRGSEMRLVKLPPDSPRGGVITMGTVLAVTSNPTRTSPVKRGLFLLENILGTPPPPAPPDIPSLEASEKTEDGEERSLREALALHREQPLCSSCHNRMDPLGLALENFNAMGSWRDKERGQMLEPAAGKLVTGEEFSNVIELKQLLVTARRTDYYHCLTEKLLTYALGRGPEPCDILTMDAIVADLEKSGGKFSTLITGIIESPAFQQRRKEIP
jgi:cytochrome c553